jgi:hypothetical protein
MLESGEQSPGRKQESKDENLRQRRQAKKTSTLFKIHTHTRADTPPSCMKTQN